LTDSVWWRIFQMQKVERGLLSVGSRSSSVTGDSIASDISKKVCHSLLSLLIKAVTRNLFRGGGCFLQSLLSPPFLPFSLSLSGPSNTAKGFGGALLLVYSSGENDICSHQTRFLGSKYCVCGRKCRPISVKRSLKIGCWQTNKRRAVHNLLSGSNEKRTSFFMAPQWRMFWMMYSVVGPRQRIHCVNRR